jgi:hypothetical protein
MPSRAAVILLAIILLQGGGPSKAEGQVSCFSGPTRKDDFYQNYFGSNNCAGPVTVRYVITDKNGKEFSKGSSDFKSCEQDKRIVQTLRSYKVSFTVEASEATVQRICVGRNHQK